MHRLKDKISAPWITQKHRVVSAYLFVLVESNPDVDFVHSLPENEGTQRHSEEGCHFHHCPQSEEIKRVLLNSTTRINRLHTQFKSRKTRTEKKSILSKYSPVDILLSVRLLGLCVLSSCLVLVEMQWKITKRRRLIVTFDFDFIYLFIFRTQMKP